MDGDRTRLWGPKDVAGYFDVPVKTVYTWRASGTGPPAIKVGKHLRYRPADVEAWLDQQATDRERAAR